MAAVKTSDQGTRYHLVDGHGNHVVLTQVPGSANVTLGPPGASVVLTKQNVTDLLTALTGFSNTGTLS